MDTHSTNSTPPALPNLGGRPPTFNRWRVVTRICAKLSNGIPLEVICREKGMPSTAHVRRWVESVPEVASAIARARVFGFDAIAADCLRIADTIPASDTHEAIQRAKLRIDTRLKLLAKWDPKRYGDQPASSVTNTTTNNIVITEAQRVRLMELRRESQAAIEG